MAKNNIISITATSLENSSFAFYLALIGVFIQFVHNLLAVAGTFNLFVIDESLILFIFEWLLAITVAAAFAASLFYFTIKAGSITITGQHKKETQEERKEKKKKYNQIIKLFAAFDTLLDFYFWVFIVFMQSSVSNVTSLKDAIAERWILLIVIIPIVLFLPQMLRFYAREIELKKWNDE